MFKTLKNLGLVILTVIIFQSPSIADETIEMLNKLNNESMVYSKKIVKVNIGDTVFWKSTTC